VANVQVPAGTTEQLQQKNKESSTQRRRSNGLGRSFCKALHDNNPRKWQADEEEWNRPHPRATKETRNVLGLGRKPFVATHRRQQNQGLFIISRTDQTKNGAKKEEEG
jgi:hypothetical protein